MVEEFQGKFLDAMATPNLGYDKKVSDDHRAFLVSPWLFSVPQLSL